MAKTFTFEAAHSLPHLGLEHKCARPHGHSYRVEIIAEGEVDPRLGWFRDYAEVSEVAGPLVARLDHRNVNDVFDQTGWGQRPTTAENLCAWFLDRLPVWVSAVRVYETATTWVEAGR